MLSPLDPSTDYSGVVSLTLSSILDTVNEPLDQQRALSEVPTITVPDVYDIAADIGKEFEGIIDQHGPDIVANLMPKVISVLEQLENFASRFRSENRELITLQLAINRLQLEKTEKAEEKSRNEKELEELELNWQTEACELHQLIDKLQEENIQLKSAIKEKTEHTYAGPSFSHPGLQTSQETHLLRLKDIVDHQKVQLRSLRRQLAQQTVDLDAMQQQAARLAKLNAVLRRQRMVSKRRPDQLTRDKLDLELALQVKESLIEQIRNQLHPSTPDCANNTFDMSASLMKELTASTNAPSELTESQLIERLNDDERMITENKKNCRLSTQEFRNLLTKRYELQSRIVDIDEQLSVYQRAGDFEAPVQGPIDREPLEKLDESYPKALGIKQFFAILLGKLSS